MMILVNPADVVQLINEQAPSTLEAEFRNPPSSAYPQVYWFWMNGNVTKEGITLDLEAMKQVGIGGVFNFDVGTGIPKGPVQYLSTEWLELKKHAIREAGRLGIEFTIHNCPGWSASGGPWITPELSMQQITWSETYISGGKPVTLLLPKPAERFNTYQDVAVIAFPSMQGEEQLHRVKISTTKGYIENERLSASEGVIAYPTKDNSNAWLQFEFEEQYEANMISFFISMIPVEGAASKPLDFGERTSVTLEASNDGIQFQKVVTINTGLDTELLLGNKYILFDIPVTRAKYFRLTSPGTRRYRQIQLSGISRLKNWMEKTNLRGRSNAMLVEPSTIHTNNNQFVQTGSIVDVNAVLDLTQFTNKEGLLQWNAPPGNWTIQRIGFTPMGTLNKAAPDTGIGLECDKFNPAAISFHFNTMMENILPVMNEIKSKLGASIDSYEAGGQNWTSGFEKIFRERKGYDLIKYFPALAGGRVVNSVDITERFLWDIRRIQADLVAENYYKRFQELCHQHNMTSYTEPYESGPFEEMQIGSNVDINLGEFWSAFSFITPTRPTSRRTTKLAASIAHINGQQLVGAEAFTAEPESARWQEYPFYLKAVGDKAYTSGVNRLVIHRFAHQPHPSAMPGMCMGPWGIHFDRTNTWWQQGKGWVTYLSRCQFMLRRGQFVADLVYFSGDDANMYTKVEPVDLLPQPIPGYDYDLINAAVIMKHLRVSNNKLVLPNGMSYRIFILQAYKAIPLELMKKLRQLVNEGMILIGVNPERSTGLSDYANEDQEFRKIASELWNDGSVTDRRIGKGRVFCGQPLQSILQSLSIDPDFEYTLRSGETSILYTHRKGTDWDLYFLSNQKRSYEEGVCTFRVKNKRPEIWDATSGKIIPVGIYSIVGDRIQLPVQFAPGASLFILFRSAASPNRVESIEKDGKIILSTKHFSREPLHQTESVSNSFTLSFWAKPEINVLLNPTFILGTISEPWTDYYAVYPTHGSKLFGEGHASCGITVGRNGIGVWEHANDNPVLVLPVKVAISGWSHIALVYENNLPSVFVNGKLISQGKKSKYTVHAITSKMPLQAGDGYYNGDMTEPTILNEAMNQEQVATLAKEKLLSTRKPFVIELAESQKPSLIIWQNGNYVFRKNGGAVHSFKVMDIATPIELIGPWAVHFPAGRGAPSHIVLPQLISLHLHSDPGVKYFSGTSIYMKDFTLTKGSLPQGRKWFLDLGRVEVIATIKLNGKVFSNLWARPFRVDVTEVLREGINKLEIEVTNQWVNRLIGDEQLPDPDQFTPGGGSSGLESATKGNIEQLPAWYTNGKPKPDDGRITFATWKHFTKDSPLIESGLIGPVILESAVLKML